MNKGNQTNQPTGQLYVTTFMLKHRTQLFLPSSCSSLGLDDGLTPLNFKFNRYISRLMCSFCPVRTEKGTPPPPAGGELILCLFIFLANPLFFYLIAHNAV